MPFALEQVVASQAPMVLYGWTTERALDVKKRFFASRPRTFALEGGFRSYLDTVMDPSSGEPYFGTVIDYDADALDAAQKADKAKSPRMVNVSSSPSLLDAEVEAAASPKKPAAAAKPTETAAATKAEGSTLSIEEQVSKFTGAKTDSRRPEWTSDSLVDTCPSCEKKFSTMLRKHHCRACGQIWCWKCARFFILLREYDYKDPERVCNACVRRVSNSDYQSNYTVYESREPNQLKILLFGPELQTRKTLEPLAQALSERYTTITFELPGVGARDRETLTEESFVKTVTAAIEKYAVGGVPVILCGVSMSAYGILKSLSSFKHRKVCFCFVASSRCSFFSLFAIFLVRFSVPFWSMLAKITTS